MKTILDDGYTWFLECANYRDFNLELVLIEGIRAQEPEVIEIEGTSLGEGYRVEPTRESTRVRLLFRDVAVYRVTQESYADFDKSEERDKGVLARVSRSSYKEFVERQHPSLEHRRPDLVHYFLFTEHEVVDVATDEPPRIEEIEGREPGAGDSSRPLVFIRKRK